MRILISILGSTVLVAQLGCTQPIVNIASYQRDLVRKADFDDVFLAARMAVQERFRLEQADSRGGVLRGVSNQYDTSPDGSYVVSESLGVPRRARRVVEVRVRDKGDNVEVLCQVFTQENATDSVRMLDRERGVEDMPFDTPADRDAGTTRAQNTVWKNKRRDRDMERQIIASIDEILARGRGVNTG